MEKGEKCKILLFLAIQLFVYFNNNLAKIICTLTRVLTYITASFIVLVIEIASYIVDFNYIIK